MARELFGMDEITPAAIDAAQAKATALRRPGERLRILRDLARLDHVQIDAFGVPAPDESGPEFFLYDLSWFDLSSGQVDASQLHQRCGVSVTDLASLRSAIEAMFARYAPLAVAVKTQHAYVRTLEWRSRGDADVEPLLARSLKGEKLGVDERLCLGDWCLERGAEQAERHDRPIKIHTGYYAGTGYLGSSFPMTGIGAARLAPLIARHPRTRFVLMHVSYPYCDELLALAKHYANVYVDLCWAWSIAPDATARFVRRAIHTVPAHKLFVFGGDTGWPGASMAYAIQARTWLARALAAEVSEGLLTEKQAMELAEDMMLNNQRACFRLSSTRSAIRAAMANAASPPAAPAPTAVATPA
jgi:predicted TIM-barrel fold metal-dependent hydrolase